MAAITQFDITKIPYENSPTFRADATYVWGLLPTVIDNMNGVIDTMNGWYIAVDADAKSALDSKNLALTYRNDTEAYRNEVMGYVIPTDATYTPAEIDKKNETQNLENFLGFNF